MSESERLKLVEDIDALIESNNVALSASVSAMSSINASFQATREALDKDLDELERAIG